MQLFSWRRSELTVIATYSGEKRPYACSITNTCHGNRRRKNAITTIITTISIFRTAELAFRNVFLLSFISFNAWNTTMIPRGKRYEISRSKVLLIFNPRLVSWFFKIPIAIDTAYTAPIVRATRRFVSIMLDFSG
jgi:hypothetical protein